MLVTDLVEVLEKSHADLFSVAVAIEVAYVDLARNEDRERLSIAAAIDAALQRAREFTTP
jgi:hypothetical protein